MVLNVLGQDDGSRETGTSGLGAWDEEDERALWSTTLQQARTATLPKWALYAPQLTSCLADGSDAAVVCNYHGLAINGSVGTTTLSMGWLSIWA